MDLADIVATGLRGHFKIRTTDTRPIGSFTRHRVSAKVLPDLLQENKGQNGVRPQSDKGRHVALEEGHWSLSGGESDEIQRSFELSGLGVHGSRLKDVQRLRHGGRNGPLQAKRPTLYKLISITIRAA